MFLEILAQKIYLNNKLKYTLVNHTVLKHTTESTYLLKQGVILI